MIYTLIFINIVTAHIVEQQILISARDVFMPDPGFLFP